MGAHYSADIVVGIVADDPVAAGGRSLLERFAAGEFAPVKESESDVQAAFTEWLSVDLPGGLNAYLAGDRYEGDPLRLVVGIGMGEVDHWRQRFVAGPMDVEAVAAAAERCRRAFRGLGLEVEPRLWLALSVWEESMRRGRGGPGA